MGTLVGTFEKYPPLTHWVKVRQIVSEPSMYSAWTHWVIDPLPPVCAVDALLLVLRVWEVWNFEWWEHSVVAEEVPAQDPGEETQQDCFGMSVAQ